ncbi:MAG: glycine C-acetyltransferase [Gammaproteobacteria bacterium]|jgi:glycine C-acetyltransferase
MKLQSILADDLARIREQGLYKDERIISSAQSAWIRVSQHQDQTSGTGEDSNEVLNFCANNYLGLANHPRIIGAAKRALDDHGFGMASVRFICGTQDLHKQLEAAIAAFLGTADAILYSSCFDANGGLFETLLDEHDAIISDALNHASIIDGVRLSKAQRFRYANADMADLEAKLIEARSARIRLIATDGVFSMDGVIAPLADIVTLAKKHDALVMVDDSHATGFVGATGRGSAQHHGVLEQIDIFTSTLGKALGGASGGFTAASQPVVDMLRQRSRPYLFSNSLAPPIVAASIEALKLVDQADALLARLNDNTCYFRTQMTDAGFDIKPGVHPIVPVMLHDVRIAQSMAADLLRQGIYVIGFSYPVVPKGEARIRVQLSAVHEREHLDQAIEAFKVSARKFSVL